MARRPFIAFAWFNVGYTILVILWGAFVRATGSGAGCGDHWPLCDGQVIPRAPGAEQLVEYTHRITSGLALLLTLGLLVWAFRAYAPGHLVRRGAVATTVFMLLEALIGAGLVLFELVAHNVSAARAVMVAIHLANTFMLLGAQTLTCWWAMGGQAVGLRGHGRLGWLTGLALAGTVVVGSSGAITALGDTLLQLGALPGGVSQPISASSHPLVQMRVVHPVLGTLVGLFSLYLARVVTQRRPGRLSAWLGWGTAGLFIAQILLGGLNVTLKAPVWMQLVHLLMADLVWITLVLLSAIALARPAEEPGRRSAPAASPARA